jgi:enamine deaminase RidA (YjgF/YER057c/UK114 family)
MRVNIAGTSPYEPGAGYSRAMRVGPYIRVAGTTATDASGQLVGLNDPYAQTVQILCSIEAALIKAGARLEHVVRTRIYVLHIARDWKEIGRAHREFFARIQPASTMLEVSRLVEPDMLVEVEADAIVF